MLLLHLNWLPNHGEDGPSIWEQPEAVLEHAPGVEQGEGDAHDLLKTVLRSPQPGALWVVDLVKELVLAEGKHGDEWSPAEAEWGHGRQQASRQGTQKEALSVHVQKPAELCTLQECSPCRWAGDKAKAPPPVPLGEQRLQRPRKGSVAYSAGGVAWLG